MQRKPMGRFRNWLTSLPLIGPLFACRWEHFVATTREFVIIIIFSTATFWLSWFVFIIQDANGTITYADLFARTTREGQLFIFATTLLGPILVFATEDPKGSRPFPARGWLMVVLVILTLICSVGYAFMKGNNPTSLNQLFLLRSATWCALTAAAGRYLAILYNKYRMGPEDVKSTEQRFTSEFERRHMNDDALNAGGTK